MGELIKIRGKNLYVEDLGKHHEQVLLYLHGGPGASCIDFCYHQAIELSKSIRVIAIDQRGVLRSDPLEDNEDFGLEDLILDCEELRKYLCIDEWSVLGHSFGGYLALIYALNYPQSVKSVLYEAPSFDLADSFKSLFNRAISYIQTEKQEIVDVRYKQFMVGEYTATEIFSNCASYFLEKLGDNKELLHLHGVTPTQYSTIFDTVSVTEEMWKRSNIHTSKLMTEGKINETLIPLFSAVSQPSCLLHGKYDPICTVYQMERFLENTPMCHLVVFENSSHFPRVEEPDKYTSEVLKFLKESQ